MADDETPDKVSELAPAEATDSTEKLVDGNKKPALADKKPSDEGKPGRFNHYRTVVLAAVLGIMLCIGFGFLGGWLATKSSANNSGLTGPVIAPKEQKVITSESQLISRIAKTVGPSVVSIDVTTQQQQTSFFGFSQPVTERAAGTGIILSSDGLIITNRHVVPQGTTKVSVTLSDGTKYDDVKVIGRTSQSDPLDIAFLKIEKTEGHELTPASIGDSSQMEVGDQVLAIGNALGQFQNTVTSGIISGHGRSLTASDEDGGSSENLQDLFQTDAAINPGNSGGPLVNMSGQVIGINVAIAGQAQNIGFSIPINDVKGLIKSVESSGELKQPYIGVHYIPLTKDYAYIYNLPVSQGAYIAPESQTGEPAISPNSPADKAGLKEKDIITAIDGTNIGKDHSLISLIDNHQPGDKVNLTVIRDGKTLHVSLTLGTMPSS